jgi:hypothetical protein
MSFARCAGIILIGAGLLLSISCEKHHVGEYPEVQKELFAPSDNSKPATTTDAAATPTPVKFFGEKKSP